MITYIALLRGINIGRNTTIAMKDLVSILKDLGLENIQTYIRSGNVVFQSKTTLPSLFSEEVSDTIEQLNGFRPKTIIITVPQFLKAIQENPFNTADGKILHLYFCKETPKNPDLSKLNAVKLPEEEYILKENVFYLYTPNGFRNSKVALKVEKILGVDVTARNWNTSKKIEEMVTWL